jgi:competence protein ComEC
VAPLIAYYFGRFSPWFLLTNFIVVPAATLILYLSLIILLVPSLSFLLIYTVGALNAIMIHIDSLPMSSIDGIHPSVVQVVFVYVVIGAAYLIFKRYKAHLK